MTRILAGALLWTAACALAMATGALLMAERTDAQYAASRCVTGSTEFHAALAEIRAHGAQYRTLADLMTEAR